MKRKTLSASVSPLVVVQWPVAFLLSLLAGVPFLLVTIPPLTDVPGHLGRFAVQTASPGDHLLEYFSFHWSLTLNLASDVVIQLLHRWIDLFPLTWAMCTITSLLTTLAIIAVARVHNPKGASALPWGLVFVFNWPFLWGFLNFSLTMAFAILAFAAWIALERWPWRRALLFVPIPPLLLIGHGVAGIVGIGLIASHTIGDALSRGGRWPAAIRRNVAPLVPLILSTLVTIIIWKVLGSSDKGRTVWLLDRKIESLVMMVRDQNKVLDIATVAISLTVGIVGWRWGARLRGGAAAAVIFVIALFLATPSLISGSDRIDTRLAPVIPMLFFALQDWSRVLEGRRRLVLVTGFALLALRWGVTTSSFSAYDRRYHAELAALKYIPQDARVLNLSLVDCPEVAWRSERLEHLSNLATVYRRAWTNSHWSIEGLQLLSVRYQPSAEYARDPSHLIWPLRCIDLREPFSRRERHALGETMPHLPIDKVDFLWLIGEHLGRGQQDRHLHLVWADDLSELYAVRAGG